MNPFTSYIQYLKDNPEHYWFKRKLYGWGWTPATKEGWAVMLSWLAVFVITDLLFVKYVELHPSGYLTAGFVLFALAMFALLIWLCYQFGEKPKWQWGLHPKDSDHR